MSSLPSSTQCEHDKTIIAMANRTRLRNDDEIDESPSSAKRQKIVATSNTIHATRYQPEDYTVSWVCALHLEMAAAHAMLDHIHGNLPRAPNDPNTYTLGSIGPHNIVITCLPSGYYGLNNAATVASNIERSFPSIEIHLMVGIGGGAPGKLDLRLGDIVVGSRVMQYDHGKIVGDGQLERTSFFSPPIDFINSYRKTSRDSRINSHEGASHSSRDAQQIPHDDWVRSSKCTRSALSCRLRSQSCCN